jgi:tetratricopeptide (TPR) repeat protein
MRRQTGVAIVALFLGGIFTKEHVIVLPALLLAAELLLYSDAPVMQRLRRLRLLLWPLVAIAGVFLVLRVQVLGAVGGDVPHPSLLHQGFVERAFIMLNVVPEYGRLMLAPVRLYADYSPRQLDVFSTPHPSHLAGILLLLSTAALFVLSVRRAPVVAFGIAWFALAVAPVSNVLLATGILLAERTLYLPSVGAMLVVAVGLDALRARLDATRSPLRLLVPLSCFAALAFGVARSAGRNAFWHDTDSAFELMVEESPLNFKAHYALGGQYFQRNRFREGELQWRMAIALMPNYHAVYMDLAHRYRQAHLCGAAIPLYEKALSLEPELTVATVSIAACQLELAQWRRARTTARVAIADGMYKRAFRYIIERADSALVANDSLDPTIAPRWMVRRPIPTR